jgi:murein L,D-transpeptidase YcbB/YkuD
MPRTLRPRLLAGAAALLGAVLFVAPYGLPAAHAQTTPPSSGSSAGSTPMKMDKSIKMDKSMKMGKGDQAKGAAASGAKKAGISRRGVEIVQAALNNNGFKLDINGRMDRETHDALKKYQADHQLKATGRIDRATLKSLDIKSLNKWS